MMAAIVDNDLGNKLKREDITALLRHAKIAGSWYLNGPADSTNSAEDIGCNWNVHITVKSIAILIDFSNQSIDVRGYLPSSRVFQHDYSSGVIAGIPVRLKSANVNNSN